MKKFNTAAEFLVLPEEECIKIAQGVVEFMSSAAEVEQNCCGDYYSHNDGFWIASTC